jgi:TRAP-type C4-dicarboxylate transport system permease large subunit
MMVISLPILIPVVVGSGWDPVWFGVFVVKGLEIAVITPPMGLNVFIVDGVVHDKDVSSTSIFKYVFPFVVADTIVIALITAFPSMCLWIPGNM